MDPSQLVDMAIAALQPLATTAGGEMIKQMIAHLTATRTAPPVQVVAALQSLPPHPSGEAVLNAVGPLYGIGGSVHVLGNDGDMSVHHAHVEGGKGSARGGDVVVQAGRGNLTIVGGTYKGGDAK